MAHSYEQKQQLPNTQYSDTPGLYPSTFVASAPTDSVPTEHGFQAPPPQYSAVDPSLQKPYIQPPHIQQLPQQPIQIQQQHVIVVQTPC